MSGDKDVLNILNKEGIFVSNRKAMSKDLLQACFHNFIQREQVYKVKFLQKNYPFAFDGYSYRGQTDSSNQAYDDMLDTFVLSDLRDYKQFPAAFWPYFEKEWQSTLDIVRNFEQAVLDQLKIEVDIRDFGHMISANYYPPTDAFVQTGDNNTRLSAHPDVSLLTVFPFGVTEGFSYEDANGTWKALPANDQWTCFPGYLMEVLSQGKIKALNHRVDLPKNASEERFSFAFFSLPHQKTSLLEGEINLSPEDYFERYLGLF